MQSCLLKQQLTEGSFHAHWQVLVSWHLIVRSLAHGCPEVGVVTRQQHLEEVVVVEQLVAIQVEVLDELLEVRRPQLAVAILSLELGKRVRIDVTRALAVDSLEGRVGFEVAHGCEDLAQALDGDLLLCVVNEHLLDFELGLVAKHFF